MSKKKLLSFLNPIFLPNPISFNEKNRHLSGCPNFINPPPNVHFCLLLAYPYALPSRGRHMCRPYQKKGYLLFGIFKLLKGSWNRREKSDLAHDICLYNLWHRIWFFWHYYCRNCYAFYNIWNEISQKKRSENSYNSLNQL